METTIIIVCYLIIISLVIKVAALKKELRHQEQLVKVFRNRFDEIKQPLMNDDQLLSLSATFMSDNLKSHLTDILSALIFYNEYLKGNEIVKMKDQETMK